MHQEDENLIVCMNQSCVLIGAQALHVHALLEETFKAQDCEEKGDDGDDVISKMTETIIWKNCQKLNTFVLTGL